MTLLLKEKQERERLGLVSPSQLDQLLPKTLHSEENGGPKDDSKGRIPCSVTVIDPYMNCSAAICFCHNPRRLNLTSLTGA